MKKSDAEELFFSKTEENELNSNSECSEHKELRKDKKYISKIQQILSYHDKTSPFHVLIVLTFREKDCVFHIIEIYEYFLIIKKKPYSILQTIKKTPHEIFP